MEQEIIKILSQLFDREIKEGENFSAETEEKWDSFKQIEIIMTIEDELGVSFNPEDIPQLNSLNKIIKKVKELKC